MTRGKPALSELEARLGHAFADPALAERALMHVSAPAARDGSYQRLEFLGDRVLGLVVSEMLYEAYPEAPEGDLSVRLARLVRRETCAEVAEEAWDVGPHVVMGAGEARGGGRRKAAILGDVAEALIGAVFIDGGFDAARGLVRRHWDARMRADAAPIQDAKTAVQEWAQARGLATPLYSEVERSGPAHLPRFVMQVELAGFEPERGEASSKRAAEQAAAQAFLERWASP